MSLSDDTEMDGNSFVWTIENFSYCFCKTNESLRSPPFVLSTNCKETWQLCIYPKGTETNSACVIYGLSFKVTEESNNSNNSYNRQTPPKINRNLCYLFSIRTKSGLFKKIRGTTDNIFSPNDIKVTEMFFLRNECHEKGIDAYLAEDALTIRCRILKVDDQPLDCVQCYFRTIICVERFTEIWSLEKFQNKVVKMLPKSPESTSFEANVTCTREDISERIEAKIKQTANKKPCFSTCVMTFLEAGSGKKVYSKLMGHWFSQILDPHRYIYEVPEWVLPTVTLPKGIADSEKLLLRCELAISNGQAQSFLERIYNGNPHEYSECSNQSEFGDVLKEDLYNLFVDGKCSDFTVRTPTKDFPVHKNILCARSEVFCAMFDCDMKEKQIGVAEIDDIQDDIVSKMLQFVYTETVEGLDNFMAFRLYIAADKYAIKALKRKCSDFLKDDLNESNACITLVLANMYSDADLKSFVQNFIMVHAKDILRTENWTNLIKDKLPLASELMYMLCLRNLDK